MRRVSIEGQIAVNPSSRIVPIPEGGSLAPASADLKSSFDLAVIAPRLKVQVESSSSHYSHQPLDTCGFEIEGLQSTNAIVAHRWEHRNYMFLVNTSGVLVHRSLIRLDAM